jgi:hypothetical protein
MINMLSNLDQTLKESNLKTKIKMIKEKNKNSVIDPDAMLISEQEPINFENFKDNFNFSKLYKYFITLYAQVPSEFKLKFIFAEFLNQYAVDYNDIVKVEAMRQVFMYFCHVFYLSGFISSKSNKHETFVKNYYQMISYYNK